MKPRMELDGAPHRQRRNDAAARHKKSRMLLLIFDVCREIGRFIACQIHVRHARMRRQKKIGKRPLAEVGLAGDGREWGRLCRTPLLVRRHNVASRAPTLGERFSFERVGGVCTRSRRSSQEQERQGKSAHDILTLSVRAI